MIRTCLSGVSSGALVGCVRPMNVCAYSVTAPPVLQQEVVLWDLAQRCRDAMYTLSPIVL